MTPKSLVGGDRLVEVTLLSVTAVDKVWVSSGFIAWLCRTSRTCGILRCSPACRPPARSSSRRPHTLRRIRGDGLVQRRIGQHEIRARLANLRAVDHQLKMRRRHMFPPLRNAEGHGRTQTHAVTIKTGLNRFLHWTHEFFGRAGGIDDVTGVLVRDRIIGEQGLQSQARGHRECGSQQLTAFSAMFKPCLRQCLYHFVYHLDLLVASDV